MAHSGENSLDIETLARFAIDEHNKKQNALLEFVKVISSKEQLVAGMIYYITLEAKDGDKNKTYEAKVWVKPWENFKELQELKLVDAAPSTLSGEITDSKGAQNSLEIETLARFAIDEHNKKQNALLEFVKVISSKEQLVAGMIYYITLEAKDGDENKTYEAKVWVKPWENFKELQELKLVDTAPSTLSGEITNSKGAENSPEIETLARFAIDEHNKKQNAQLEFVNVISSKEQLVAGMIYYITLEAKDGDANKTYEAKIWVKPWENFKALHELKLVDAAPSTLSGEITESKGAKNSLEIETLARFAIDEHNKKQNALLEFVKVISSKEQLVAGMIYYITLQAKDGDENKTYEAKVWVKAWENFVELQEFKLVDATTSV